MAVDAPAAKALATSPEYCRPPSAITGTPGGQPIQQELAFVAPAAPGPAAPAVAWVRLTNPAERLAAFTADGTQPRRERTEAETVLRLYRKRTADLAARLDFRVPEIIPLGLLMLVPESAPLPERRP